MKMLKYTLLCTVLGMSCLLIGYKRCSYVQHSFCLPTQDSHELLQCLIKRNVTQAKRPMTYCVVQNDCKQDYIYLTRLDKRRVTKSLQPYSLDTIVNAAFINELTTRMSGKRKKIVFSILQDFSQQPEVTIGQILDSLGVEHSKM